MVGGEWVVFKEGAMEPTKVYLSITMGDRRLILDGDAVLLPFLRDTLDSKMRELRPEAIEKEDRERSQGQQFPEGKRRE